MELKELFGSEALTWEQFNEKLETNKVKLANLSDGGYVDINKLNAKQKELDTANATIANLQNTVKKYDGVDVDGLKKAAKDWEDKYNADLLALQKDNAVDMAIVNAKGKNAKAIKALLDLEKVTLKDGKLEGLDLDAVKKSDPYLFTVEETRTEGNGNGNGGGSRTDELSAARSEIAAIFGNH